MLTLFIYHNITKINLWHSNGSVSLAHTVKNPPAMQETQIYSLDWEDALEKGMATAPVFLPGESHGQMSLVSYSLWALSIRYDWATETTNGSVFLFIFLTP